MTANLELLFYVRKHHRISVLCPLGYHTTRVSYRLMNPVLQRLIYKIFVVCLYEVTLATSASEKCAYGRLNLKVKRQGKLTSCDIRS